MKSIGAKVTFDFKLANSFLDLRVYKNLHEFKEFT